MAALLAAITTRTYIKSRPGLATTHMRLPRPLPAAYFKKRPLCGVVASVFKTFYDGNIYTHKICMINFVVAINQHQPKSMQCFLLPPVRLRKRSKFTMCVSMSVRVCVCIYVIRNDRKRLRDPTINILHSEI